MGDEANVFTTSWDFSFDGASGAPVGRRAVTELLGATIYELEPGAKWANLHIHHANEELIVVLRGTPTVGALEGERELATGEVVACPRGRPGAHCLENRSDETARVLIESTMNMPEVVEYPERDDAFVMTEPPYTGGSPEGETRGRLLRVFHRADGAPVAPDPGAET
jgi:uncharacterized cupin superfamily protein